MRYRNVEQPFNLNPIVIAEKWVVRENEPDTPQSNSGFVENCRVFDSVHSANNYCAKQPKSVNLSPMKVCVCLPPGEIQKSPMTFDQFFAEAERTGLTANALMPALATKLDAMEESGEIRKHVDGGHEFVIPSNESTQAATRSSGHDKDLELARSVSALIHAGVMTWNDRDLGFFDDHEDEIKRIAEHIRRTREATNLDVISPESEEKSEPPKTRIGRVMHWLSRNGSALIALALVSFWIVDVFWHFEWLDSHHQHQAAPTYGLPFTGPAK